MATLPHKDTWERFKRLRDMTARDELITRYAYLVNITVGRVVVNLPPQMDREDLVGAGMVGLIKAVDQFDLSRDVKFETYGIALIRGAVLEMLREQDWVPRSIRDRVKAVERAMAHCEQSLGRPATEYDIAECMKISLDQYHRLLSESGRTRLVSLDELLLGNDDSDGPHRSDALADTESDTSRSVELKERRRRLAEAIDRLPPVEKRVIALYYRDRLTFKEIGRVLERSESRAYQLHSQAVGRLRKDIAQDLPLFQS